MASHCIASHCIASHCIASHCIASHCIASHYIASHRITAGEIEHENRLDRTSKGGVIVPPALLKDMRDLRERFPEIAAKYPKFSFEK